jgi:type IV secretory pathway VirD2 relaxase
VTPSLQYAPLHHEILMSRDDNDQIRPRLGRPKSSGGGRSRTLVGEFLARGVKLRSVTAKRSPSGSRKSAAFHRGSVAMRVRVRAPSTRSRRVTVKARIVNLKQAGTRSITTHLRYIERDGVTADGSPGQAYDANLDAADTAEFASRSEGDRHQFRFIVSPEDGVEIGDLREFTREVMTHMERDLGTRLEWVAADHWDTDNPHTHVVLRGKDAAGKDLVIDRTYITHGMRFRATEIADSWLGLRSELEIQNSLKREVQQDRWTGLDRSIQERLVDGVVDVRRRPDDTPALAERNLLMGQLQHLGRMRLAEETAAGIWSVDDRAEAVLRAMGERGDIIRTLQRTFSKERRDFKIVGPDGPRAPIVGRVAAKGLADELHDRRYLILDGIDGRAHYLTLPVSTDGMELPIGAIVAVTANNQPRSADQTIAKLADEGVYLTSDHLQVATSHPTPGRTPDAIVQAHERRLEALRRAGIVERVAAGIWRIPADLAQRGLEYDVRRQGSVELKILSTLPIERQVSALGATWVDRQLMDDTSAVSQHGFGAEARRAMRQRLAYLVENGLAERSGTQVTMKGNLLATLRHRELDAVAGSIAADSGLTYRDTQDGESIRGVYRRPLDLASGRFAMLDDGVGFSLVPWRPVMDAHLGNELRGIAVGGNINWDFSRSRGLSR